jgi:hypothetical protein
VKSLRLNKDIRILQTDKCNCAVVLDDSKYRDKSDTLLESRINEPLPKVERKLQKLLSKHKTTVATAEATTADFLFLTENRMALSQIAENRIVERAVEKLFKRIERK